MQRLRALFAVMLAGCMPWSVAGEARLGGLGFHPVLAPGARATASARLTDGSVVDVRLGPEVAWSEHAAFGHALSLSGVPAVRFHIPVGLALGVELPLGASIILPSERRWTVDGANYVPSDALGPVSGRLGLALTLHVDLDAISDLPGAIYVRYEQAILAPFAENAGLPVMPTSHVGLGFEVELPE